MEKIMLTGASGFIGQYVTKLLEANYELSFVEGNIFDINFDEYMKTEKPDYLINLAWVTGQGYLDSYDNVRFVQKGIEMYEAFYKYGGKRAVYVGTEQEYERKNTPLKESDTIQPISLYAECKADLGKILVKNSQLTDKGFVWARLFFIYGAGEKPQRLMPSIIKGLLNQEEVVCSYEGYVRDYIHVEDVASAIVTCLFADYTGCVNIGGGKPTTIGKVAEMIKELVGGEGRVTFRTHEECQQPMCVQADISLLESLGWKQKYSLKDGLETEVQALHQNK